MIASPEEVRWLTDWVVRAESVRSRRLPEAVRRCDMGDGWQVSAGPSTSRDVNNGLFWLREHLF
jgi:hypothetical protein